MRRLTIAGWLFSALAAVADVAGAAAPAANVVGDQAVRPIRVDAAGTMRWRDNGQELALFGANYCLMSGSDYRMAGLIGAIARR